MNIRKNSRKEIVIRKNNTMNMIEISNSTYINKNKENFKNRYWKKIIRIRWISRTLNRKIIEKESAYAFPASPYFSKPSSIFSLIIFLLSISIFHFFFFFFINFYFFYYLFSKDKFILFLIGYIFLKTF